MIQIDQNVWLKWVFDLSHEKNRRCATKKCSSPNEVRVCCFPRRWIFTSCPERAKFHLKEGKTARYSGHCHRNLPLGSCLVMRGAQESEVHHFLRWLGQNPHWPSWPHGSWKSIKKHRDFSEKSNFSKISRIQKKRNFRFWEILKFQKCS